MILSRVLPFAVFMGFIALNGLLDWAAAEAEWLEAAKLWLYPLRTVVVAGTLIFFWRSYDELREGFGGAAAWGLATVVGVAVYLAWVRMDWPWAMQGDGSGGYHPFAVEGTAGYLLAAMRLLGAAAVVPLMEELFWRSFLMRYLVDSRFNEVRLGTFTPLSFGATVVLFGVEHDLWLAGMVAGAAYNLLLCRTGRLWPCIWAHAVTNLLLGIHVLATGEWHWW